MSWKSLKGPYSGNISVLTVDRQGYCYSASHFAGVYKSTDDGQTWEQVNNSLNWLGLSTLFVDSSNSIYAGSIFNGLYKSTNNGTTWVRTSLTRGAQYGLTISGGRLCVGGLGTVSISTDRGETWTSSIVGGEAVAVNSLAEDGLGNIYAGLDLIKSLKSPPSGGGVYLSSDGGRTWHSDGMTLDSISAIVAGKSNDVFASNGYTVFSAVVKDSNWVQNSFGLPPARVAALSNSPSGDVVAAVAGNLYVYDEALRFWVFVGGGTIPINCLHYDPAGVSYAGTDRDGIFRMAGMNAAWSQCGIFPAAATAVGFDRTGNLYVGTGDGIYTPGLGSGTWYRISNGLAGGRVYQIDTLNTGKGIFAATSAGVFSSTDSGANWIPRSSILTYSLTQNYADTLYAGTTSGVLASTDGGRDWLSISSIGFPISTVYSVLGLGSEVFAGTRNNGVFVTTDGGYFWSQTGISSPLMFCSVRDLAPKPSPSTPDASQSTILDERIYAGTDSSGVYYTNDSGIDWTHVDGITASDISTFLFTRSLMFVGTLDGGVFVSTNGGLSWGAINDGLTGLSVSSMGMDRQGFLYAATDSGIFKTAGPVTEVVPLYHHTPEIFSLSQNYPNPFNPATTISYELSAISQVSLKVYDILGREVATLVNGKETAGSHSVVFDGSRLPSGVYFYRIVMSAVKPLAVGDKVITKKMVLVK